MTSGENPYQYESAFTDFSGNVPFSQLDNRFDAGLCFGAGLEYNWKALSFFAEWRYNYTLTNMSGAPASVRMPRVNEGWTLQAGVLFRL
jgi:hypothetical protein